MNAIAKSLQVLRGSLSRWILPFDHNTRIDSQCSTPHSVVENMPEEFRGKLTERQVHYPTVLRIQMHVFSTSGAYKYLSFYLNSRRNLPYYCYTLHYYYTGSLPRSGCERRTEADSREDRR